MEVYVYNKDKVLKGSLEDLNKPNKFVWVDMLKPKLEDLKKISKHTGISMEELKYSLSDDERPRIVDIVGDYTLIIFAAPAFAEEVLTGPVFIYISKLQNNVITLRNRDTRSISRIKSNIEANKPMFSQRSSYFVYRLMDQILTTYFSVVDNIEEEIDKIEDQAIAIEKSGHKTGKNHKESILSRIFRAKKTLLYFQKSLTANREVIVAVEKQYVADIDRKTQRLFRSLYADIVQLSDMASTYREILSATQTIYSTAVSNTLNKVMKTLTIIAAFVLVPNLIASIYGMNFSVSDFNMPELHLKYGYFLALGLMLLSVVSLYVYFKRKGWLTKGEIL